MTARDNPLPAPLAVPDPGRLDPSRPDYGAILAAHGHALDAGEDGYLDPSTGWWCFSAAYRGHAAPAATAAAATAPTSARRSASPAALSRDDRHTLCQI